MTALFGTACSGWTLWLRYEQRSLIVGLQLSSSAAFRALLTGERDRPLCSNETSDLRQNWTLWDHRTSPLRITLELLSLEPRGCLHMHAYGKLNTHRRRRVQIWGACLGLRHHIMTSSCGPPFCISCSRNVQCSMNVEDCVISKICNGNSIMVNTVTLENYKVNCWDISLLCNIDGTGPLCLARPTL